MNMITCGVNPISTIDLLKERALRRKKNRALKDDRRVGLIVEGGAMRGVISCAALMALEELGMTEVFDEVYGGSAGAVNAAYFLAGQAAYATTLYYQKINNTRFLRRFWHRKIVDIDDLFDSIIAGSRPLRTDKVLASRSQLFVTIADACTGEAFLGHAQSSRTPLLTLLKQLWLPNLFNFIRIRAKYNAMATDKNPYLKKGWKANNLPVRVGIVYMLSLIGVLTACVVYHEELPWLAVIPAVIHRERRMQYLPRRVYT